MRGKRVAVRWVSGFDFERKRGANMAGMRTKKSKGGGKTFTFSGGLSDAIEAAERELREKENSQKRVFLKWQRDNAVKAYENYEKRIDDLQDFIPLAKEELKKRQEAVKAKEENENE